MIFVRHFPYAHKRVFKTVGMYEWRQYATIEGSEAIIDIFETDTGRPTVDVAVWEWAESIKSAEVKKNVRKR